MICLRSCMFLQYPGEPYRETWNRTILAPHLSTVYFASDTALALEAVRSMYPSSRDGNNYGATAAAGSAMPPSSSSTPLRVWTHLDVEQRGQSSSQNADADDASLRPGGFHRDKSDDTAATSKANQSITFHTNDDDQHRQPEPPQQPTSPLAVDPPHLNFDELSDPSGFYGIFVDLFLMSRAHCVTFGAGGFGRFGSLVSHHPTLGFPYTKNGGVLQNCTTNHRAAPPPSST
jgi:hypothetical protein